MIRLSSARSQKDRTGAIIIFVATMIVVLMMFTAIVVDVGFVAVTKTQMQAADDASTLAGGTQLVKGLGVGATLTPNETTTLATATAVEYASWHRNGDLASSYVDGPRDVRFGYATFNPATGIWTKSWGIQPFNMIGVTLHRDQGAGGAGDSSLPLFFGGIYQLFPAGQSTANVVTVAAAALIPGSTFSITPGSSEPSPVLPFAIDQAPWNQLVLDGISDGDEFYYDADTHAVTSGSDGVLEIKLYPEGALTSGNFGTWDAGAENNSNADTTRQILYGMNEDDFSYFNYEGEVGTLGASESEPLIVSADTGLSAGFKDELADIIGDTRAAAIYREQPTGVGETATYKIIKFVGIKIVDVDLTGKVKYVRIQPATLVHGTINPDFDGDITEDSIFAPLMLIE